MERVTNDQPAAERKMPAWLTWRNLTWRNLAMLVVTLVAAGVSYTHIETLMFAHHQPLWDARLTPVSVDGCVAATSATVFSQQRTKDGADWVPRAMMWLAMAATLAANLAFGWPGGPISAVGACWPAVAFIGCAETVIRDIRKQAASEPVRPPVTAAPPVTGKHADRRPRAASAAARLTPADKQAAVLELRERYGDDLTGTELAALLATRGVKVTDRTARRYRQNLDGAPADVVDVDELAAAQ